MTVQCTALEQKDKATFSDLLCNSPYLFVLKLLKSICLQNIKVLKFVLKIPLIIQI